MATSHKEAARVTLPGRMFQKQGRWWWSVQLPGEARCRARGLRAPNERTATSDRGTAEAAALELWQAAVREEVQAEIMAEFEAQSAEKSRAYAFLINQIMEPARPSIRQAPWTAPSPFQIQAESLEPWLNESVQRSPDRHAPDETNITSFHEPEPMIESSLDLLGMLSEEASTQDRQGCECCGSKDFFDEYLQTGESGQKLCPRCVKGMHEDTLTPELSVI